MGILGLTLRLFLFMVLTQMVFAALIGLENYDPSSGAAEILAFGTGLFAGYFLMHYGGYFGKGNE